MPSYPVQFSDSFDDSSLDTGNFSVSLDSGSVTETSLLTIYSEGVATQDAMLVFDTPLARGGEWAIEVSGRLHTDTTTGHIAQLVALVQNNNPPTLSAYGNRQTTCSMLDVSGTSYNISMDYIDTGATLQSWDWTTDQFDSGITNRSPTKAYSSTSHTIRLESDATNLVIKSSGYLGTEDTDNIAWTDIRDTGQASMWAIMGDDSNAYDAKLELTSFTYEAPNLLTKKTGIHSANKAAMIGLVPGLRLF